MSKMLPAHKHPAPVQNSISDPSSRPTERCPQRYVQPNENSYLLPPRFYTLYPHALSRAKARENRLYRKVDDEQVERDRLVFYVIEVVL